MSRRLLPVLLALSALGAGAAVLPSPDEALRLAFGKDARFAVVSHWPDAEARRRIAERSGGEPPPTTIRERRATDADGRDLGSGWFLRRRIRTHLGVFLIAITPDGRVLRVEPVRFDEPRRYLPSRRWWRQFEGLGLDDDLRLGGAVDAASGATLTSRAAVDAVREALAVHEWARSTPPPESAASR